jgi:acyl-CoA hydrolase
MPTVIDETALAHLVRPHQLVFVPGSSGAPQAFMDDVLRDPARSDGMRLLTTYVPGINRLDIDALAASVRVTGLFMQPSLSAAQCDRRYRILPMSYNGFVRHVRENVDIDLAVVQLSLPDAQGRCSLGPAAEFMPVALGKSRRVLGLLNRQTPYLPGAPSLAFDELDYVCEVDTPLPVYSPGIDAASQAISAHIAEFIDDGSALQVGLGKVPTALMRLLANRRRLRLHSGMLSDGLIDLAEAGALDPDFIHTACVLVGSERFYRWAPEFAALRLVGCEVTHDPRTLIDLDRFVSVNSALEVDLFGQCNLEHAGGRSVSGVGGAPDFARAARQSHQGCSIVALNATYRRGAVSRIVPCLTDHSITSLSRVDVDVVITEHGVARLSGACVHERAEALIAVAAPAFREGLAREWRAVAARL